MDNDHLLEYVSIVMDLEKDKFIQSQAIEQLDQTVVSMQNEKASNEAAIKNTVVEYDLNSIRVQPKDPSFLLYLFLISLGFIPGGLLHEAGVPEKPSAVICVIGAVVVLICCILHDRGRYQKEEAKLLKEKRAEVMRTLENNRKLNQQRRERNQALALSIPTVQKEREVLAVTNNDTETLLNKYYSLNIIPVQYRNLVAVCSFYDYLSAGRTFSIRMNVETHDEGAVNIFEREQRMGLIISKLDEIVCNLQSLREEQRALRYAIEDGNRITHSLLENIASGIGETNDNLTSIQYQNEQSLKNQQYMTAAAYQYYTKSFG